MKTIRWGMIGCGAVAEVKSGPALQKARRSELVAVMCRRAEKARDYAERHFVPRWYGDAQALISDPGVDAIYVATPPSSHKQYALMAAAAAKPVYVEKPMALNYAECREMLSACREAGVPLFVAYYRRALSRFLKIKELIDGGKIGEVRGVTILQTKPVRPDELDRSALLWRVQPEIAGGGWFVDQAAHQLDFLDFVLGPIRSVQGFAANQAGLYPAEDIVSGAFTFESGVQGVGLWCYTASAEVDRTEIVGSKGSIAFTTFDDAPVVVTSGDKVETHSINSPPHIQQPLIQTIVDELLGEGRCLSDGESAARTSWVMDQMLADYYHA
ncbi:MAG: Gfo/Idh/MocA family oxidoreductase [Caldilineales bacterium]|nr:Gfo/Idh/MocA family oxidoreductase [Caldilineales bacterium]